MSEYFPLSLLLLRDAFPDWSIWRSDVGNWYATRRTVTGLSEPALEFGVAMTITADHPADLRAQLADQHALAEKAAEQLGGLT
jgi:hypothetical protein